jgi:putative DNA primase/helicase
MNTYMREYSAKHIAHALGRARQSGEGWICCCPAHDDEKPSLSLTDSNEGKILIHCFADCSYAEVVDRLKERKLWTDTGGVCTTYDYVDANKKLIYQVIKYPNKRFGHRRPDGHGDWFWNMHGVEKLLYCLPELLVAINAKETIFIVEGEKDCENLAKFGLTATTNSGGAGKWKDDFSRDFKDAKQVFILPDNDDVGRAHANKVAASLHKIGVPVKVVPLPGVPEKGDVSDWLNTGGTKDQLLQLCADAAVWIQESEPAEQDLTTPAPSPGLNDIGNAERFKHMFGTEVLWVSTIGKWFVWSGKNWVIDDLEKVFDFAKRVAGSIFEEAKHG